MGHIDRVQRVTAERDVASTLQQSRRVNVETKDGSVREVTHADLLLSLASRARGVESRKFQKCATCELVKLEQDFGINAKVCDACRAARKTKKKCGTCEKLQVLLPRTNICRKCHRAHELGRKVRTNKPGSSSKKRKPGSVWRDGSMWWSYAEHTDGTPAAIPLVGANNISDAKRHPNRFGNANVRVLPVGTELDEIDEIAMQLGLLVVK